MNVTGNAAASSDDRCAVLLAGYVAGQLDAPGRAELLGLIRAHPQAAEAAGRDVVVDRLLGFALGGIQSEDAFVRAVRMRLSAELDGPEFARRVARSIKRTHSGRRSWRTKLAPLALAASLLAAVGTWLWKSEVATGNAEVVARVVEKKSEVRSQRSGGAWAELAVGHEIKAGARIETGKDGVVKLAWVKELTTVEAEGNSKFDIRHSQFAYLEAGHLTASVAKQDPARPFVVATPRARVTVQGTKFEVVEFGNETLVKVTEGRVEVSRADGSQGVGIGATEAAVVEGDKVPRKLLNRKWTFGEGATADLKVLGGRWRWERGQDGVGRMIPNGEVINLSSPAVAIALPLDVPRDPFLVVIRGRVIGNQGSSTALSFTDQQPRRQWTITPRKTISGGQPYADGFYFVGSFHFAADASGVREGIDVVQEYDRTGWWKTVSVGLGNRSLEFLSVRELDPVEREEALSILRAHLKKIGDKEFNQP